MSSKAPPGAPRERPNRSPDRSPESRPDTTPPLAPSSLNGPTTGPPPAVTPSTGAPATNSPPASAPAAPGRAAVIHETRAPRRRRRRLLLLIPLLLIIGAVGAVVGYRYWYDTTYFVSTDNAQVAGDLVQVGSLNAGRLVATRLDIGAKVQAGQELAVVAMPQQVGSTPAGTAPRMDVINTSDTLVSVPSPLTGIVAARLAYVGGTVAAGQPIYALVDPKNVWIRANIEESVAWRLEAGQPVEVHADALGRTLPGRVDAITPASAATFSLLPSSNVSGNYTKVTQYVPVKIAVDAGDATLPLGTSVEVKIRVAEPTSSFPLPWRP
ncbi:MAG: HlyD family secretion protein [Chloroflexi bacterium]|nr:HlyD family secretion protein [Chloroflexota bacterium]